MIKYFLPGKFLFTVYKRKEIISITAIIMAFMVVIVSIYATMVYVERRDLVNIATARAESYALALSTDVQWYLDVARQSLRRVDQALGKDINGVGMVSSEIAQLVDELPNGVRIVVYDLDGNSRLFSDANHKSVNIGDRDYFLNLKNGHDWSISNLIQERGTGEQTFAVGHKLSRGGKFYGAVVAYAPMHIFSKVWSAFAAGRDSNAFIVHLDGWLTARLPIVQHEIFSQKLPDDFVDRFKGEERGAFTMGASPIDGVSRIIGFDRVPGSPLVAVVGISREAALAPFWRSLEMQLLVGAPILLALILASYFNIRMHRDQEILRTNLSRANKRNEVLLREIHHRVKNNLQAVASLVRLHDRNGSSSEDLSQRIAAMVAVHEHIYQNDEFDTIDAREYIGFLVRQTVEGISNGAKVSSAVDGDPILISPDLAMPLGQMVSEVVTNSIKYGFTDGREGEIAVSLTRLDDCRARLVIRDNGVGFDPEDGNTGMGSRLIKSFARQMNGEATLSSADGVEFCCEFSLQ